MRSIVPAAVAAFLALGSLGALAQSPATAARPMAPAAKPVEAPAAARKAQPLDINTASAAELDALPGIGAARAAAIIKGRPYNGKDDLINRGVIPSNAYNGIKDMIVARQPKKG